MTELNLFPSDCLKASALLAPLIALLDTFTRLKGSARRFWSFLPCFHSVLLISHYKVQLNLFEVFSLAFIIFFDILLVYVCIALGCVTSQFRNITILWTLKITYWRTRTFCCVGTDKCCQLWIVYALAKLDIYLFYFLCFYGVRRMVIFLRTLLWIELSKSSVVVYFLKHFTLVHSKAADCAELVHTLYTCNDP